MPITKTAHNYLNKALLSAKADRQKLEDELNKYLSPVETPADAKRILDMNFDIIKNTDDRVKLDLAIADLTNILYWNKPRKD